MLLVYAFFWFVFFLLNGTLFMYTLLNNTNSIFFYNLFSQWSFSLPPPPRLSWKGRVWYWLFWERVVETGWQSLYFFFEKISPLPQMLYSFWLCMCAAKSFSHVLLSAMLWTIALQAPLSMGFSRQEYWSGLPFPSPGDLPDLGDWTRGLNPCLYASRIDRWVLNNWCHLYWN